LQRRDGPGCLILSRQGLTPFTRDKVRREDVARGGYILRDTPQPQAVLIATGSEVEIAMKAASMLQDEAIAVRVVSMPCVEVFFAPSPSWQDQVLPPGLPRVSIEAGASGFWRGVVNQGTAIGIDTFGESAPAGQLYHY